MLMTAEAETFILKRPKAVWDNGTNSTNYAESDFEKHLGRSQLIHVY